jgi:hypothetical protein
MILLEPGILFDFLPSVYVRCTLPEVNFLAAHFGRTNFFELIRVTRRKPLREALGTFVALRLQDIFRCKGPRPRVFQVDKF